MRVYLASTLPGLAKILADGQVGPAPLRAFAVTPALREAYASGDDEELEYVAMLAAGHVDDLGAAADVAAAADAIAAADAGDDDASFTVDSAEAHELAWYATQELQYLF